MSSIYRSTAFKISFSHNQVVRNLFSEFKMSVVVKVPKMNFAIIGSVFTHSNINGASLSAMEEVKKIWRETDAVMLDVDSTVVKEEGIDRLAEFCGKGPEVSKITSDAMNKGLDFREALKLRFNIMNPSLKQLEDFIRLYPTTLTPGVQDLVELLKSRSIPVYLVSGGLRRIIEPTRVLLNIPEENVFANRLLFENGKYVGFDLNEPTSKSRGKSEVAAMLKKKFCYKKLVMIGDGSIDAEASPPADAFIGFGGNIIRENVRAKAKWFVTSFKELIDELKV